MPPMPRYPHFDPAATLAAARSTCQPIAQENAAALAWPIP